MHTIHKFYYKDSRSLNDLGSNSVHLVITSPPYPMIAMWDEIFKKMNPEIGDFIESEDGFSAFQLMHVELKKVWEGIYRVLIPGGHVCINIGDATRTIGNQFQLFPNHSEIIRHCNDIGFTIFPEIIWRKPSNSPTKFMGSGMLPGGAYVTLEHERILILRKPDKREFKNEEEKQNRRQSSYFWVERNIWFSDMWELNGVRQDLNEKKIRKRSGAFPFEIPFRLVNMFSSKLDTVLDPFLGTATTTLAAIACGRNSIGYELNRSFRTLHLNEILSPNFIQFANNKIHSRIKDQLEGINDYIARGKTPKYKSSQYDFPVITNQEIDVKFELIKNIVSISNKNSYKATYSSYVHEGNRK